MSREKIKATVIESQLEWSEAAKKMSPAVADITATFSDENKLLKLVQVMNKCLVATDEIGSVRVFREPFSGKGASQICIEHLNEVYICDVSPDSRLLVTVSREDRAMHFWEFVDRNE
jgi:WD40 repeat protein